MMRVGVLASGNGSNFQALVDALNVEGPEERQAARVVALLCNCAGAKVLDRARDAKVPAVLMEHGRWSTREAFDEAIADELVLHGVELVCLAGYMRLLTPTFLRRYAGRVINIHPALLPAFPGLHAAKQALDYGVRMTGCTVHFVDEGTDTGPIIAQAAVPVIEGDIEATLSARIQKEEHRLYPAVVRGIARGAVLLSGRKVSVAEPLE